jgi:hypothetical protein
MNGCHPRPPRRNPGHRVGGLWMGAEDRADVVPAEGEGIRHIAISTDFATALPRRWLRSHLLSGSSRFLVGGNCPRASASTVAAASTTPAPPRRCRVTLFVELTIGCSSPNTTRMAFASARSPMRVDQRWVHWAHSQPPAKQATALSTWMAQTSASPAVWWSRSTSAPPNGSQPNRRRTGLPRAWARPVRRYQRCI